MEDHSNYICFRWSVSYFALKWLKSCTETSQTKLSLMQILSTSMQCSHCHHLLQTQKRWHLPHETIFFSFYKMLFFDNTNCKFLFFSLNIDILHLLLYSKQILRKKRNQTTTPPQKQEERSLWYLQLTSKESLHSYWAQNILRNQMFFPAWKPQQGRDSLGSQSTEICCSGQNAAASSVSAWRRNSDPVKRVCDGYSGRQK